MRLQGKIAEWKDDRGFGFIVPRGGGEKVFVHIRSFSNRQRRPVANEIVTYDLVSDPKGRHARAEHVAFINDSPTIPVKRGMGAFVLPGLFLTFVAVAVLVGQLPLLVIGLYFVASTVSFSLYAHDKSAAQKGEWRTKEGTLHLFSLIGGWPGALAAQKLLRHKSRKQSFRIVFWATVVLNCAGLACLLSPPGAAVVRSVFGAMGW